MASLYGNVPMIERLLTAGADAKQRLANGETMVMLAARNGNPLAIRTLVAAGADVNAKENLRGTTALMWVAEQRHSVAVKMLLEVGADYSAKSGPAGLPRNYMAPRVNTAAVRDAARRHAARSRSRSERREGRTALMGAALKGRNDVVQMLVDWGARLDTRDGGSRDTDTNVSAISGHTWQALDYADGLVRPGVQSAVPRPETAALLRTMMTDRGLPVPPPNRVVESICVVELCQERVPKKDR